MKTSILTFFAALMVVPFQLLFAQSAVKIAVVGLTHSHVHWILGREDVGDVEIVGIGPSPYGAIWHRQAVALSGYGVSICCG